MELTVTRDGNLRHPMSHGTNSLPGVRRIINMNAQVEFQGRIYQVDSHGWKTQDDSEPASKATLADMKLCQYVCIERKAATSLAKLTKV